MPAVLPGARRDIASDGHHYSNGALLASPGEGSLTRSTPGGGTHGLQRMSCSSASRATGVARSYNASAMRITAGPMMSKSIDGSTRTARTTTILTGAR